MKRSALAPAAALLAGLVLASCSQNVPVTAPPAPSAALPAITEAPSPRASETAAPSASQSSSAESSGPIIYKNEDIGISLEFPGDWKGKYLVAEEGNILRIISRNTRDADKRGYDGELFRIVRETGELITTEDIAYRYFKGKIILRGNGYTYISSIGNGYNGPWPRENNPGLYDEYQEMFKKRDAVCQTARLLGNKRPVPSNTGYRVIGSSFFTAEIPADWDLKVSSDSIIRWDVYSGGSAIGTIEMVPCYGEKLPGDAKTMREYVFDGSGDSADALITLSAEKADKTAMEKIKSAFKLVPNESTVVFLQSRANKLVAKGGEKVFGRFEGFNRENGLNISLNICLMSYVADDSAKGYRIEDVKQLKTYPIGSMVDVVAPVKPNCMTYGPYGHSIIDAGTKNGLDRDTYYDFIIYEGKVEMIMGRYLP